MNDQNIFQKTGSWFLGNEAVLAHGVKIVLILALAFLIIRFLNFFIEKGIKRIVIGASQKEEKKREETLLSVFGGTTRFVVWIIAVLMILPEFGLNVTAILAGMSIMGLAIGMGMKDIISDFISGLFIILEDQYHIGDKVKVAGIEGRVKEINLRRTILYDELGFSHSIPNSQIKIVGKRVDK